MRLSSLSDILAPSSFVSCPGDDIKLLYRGVRKTPTAPLELVVDGKLSISEYINSFGACTDMSYILSRLRAGDSSVLFSTSDPYGDTTIFPTNPAEALQYINNATAYFDQLPDSVRGRFDNRFDLWIKSAGTKEWIDKMVVDNLSGTPASPVPDVTSDV